MSSLLDRILRREVIRHPDGSVELRGFSVGAIIRWHRKQNWRKGKNQ